MKYLFVLLIILFSGCASVSEYDQGCRDGIEMFVFNTNGVINKSIVNYGCDKLDQIHKQQKQSEREEIGNRK